MSYQLCSIQKATPCSARSMVLGKRNIFNKHVSTSRTSLSTQRTTHPAKIKSEQPVQQNFRQRISKTGGTFPKATKRFQSQIYLRRRKAKMTEHTWKVSTWILSMYGTMM